MASFGSSKRSVFKPTAYGNSRRPRRIPRWLVLMLTGVVLGSGGLLFLQKNYGPPRLTIEQSEQLHNDINSTNLDKQRLQSQLNQQTHDLTEAKASLATQTVQLTSTATIPLSYGISGSGAPWITIPNNNPLVNRIHNVPTPASTPPANARNVTVMLFD